MNTKYLPAIRNHRGPGMTLRILTTTIAALALTGCAGSGANMPLIFGQTQTVGLAMGGSTSDQGVDLTLGYKDRNFAIVPVTVKQSSGSTQITSTATAGHQDALSVLGQFEVKADAKAGNVGLGKFFATGLAAKVLADGFAEKLKK